MTNSVNSELIRSHADTIILRVLQEKDRYGYEILDLISSSSEGRFSIKQPTLYSCLKRLEKQGFISSYYGEETHGGRRRYYKLTEKGIKTLEQDQREWEFSRSILDRLLSNRQVDLKSEEPPFDATGIKPLTKRVKVYPEKPYRPVVIPVAMTSKPHKEAEGKEDKKEPELKEKQVAAEAKEKPAAAAADKDKEEQRLAAAKLLQIGEFAPPAKLLIEQQITGQEKKAPVEEKEPGAAEKPYYKTENYKDVLGSLFQKPAPSAPAAPEAATAAAVMPDIIKTDDQPVRSRQFYDLKLSLESEGYKLKSYTKANAVSQYYMNYIYSNRIIRDTSFLVYLTVIIELIIMYIGREIFSYGLNVLIPMGAAGLIIPIAGLIIWALNPTKRIKARFNFSTALINSVIAYIFIVAVTTIIYLVAPSIDIDFTDGRMYVPYILAINLPVFVLIYNFLYKSKHYHLK